MGDMRDEYDAYKAHSKNKKESNKESSISILENEKIVFEVKNNGIHLIVTSLNGRLIDFYPTTGKWIERGGKTSRGVLNLIRHIKGEQ